MRYFIADGEGGWDEVSWEELAEVNEPETMEEIARLQVGESTVLGQCDEITRVA